MNSKDFLKATPAANDSDLGWTRVSDGMDGGSRQNLVDSLDRLLDQVAVEAFRGLESGMHGAHRQWRGIEAHLNACLRRPALPALIQALQSQAGPARLRQRHQRLSKLLRLAGTTSNHVLSGREPRTLAAMVLEVERVEQVKGCAANEYRSVLRRYLHVGPASQVR